MAAAAYKHEEVAKTPAGYRVRSVKRGGHVVRVAFPPGPRSKGAGKVVAILHPKGETNPNCIVSNQARTNPGELIIFGNPSTHAAKRATRERAARIRGARLNPTYVYFTFNGRDYRTDGQTVEGKDGQKWNRTGSLPVVLAARKEWAARKPNPRRLTVPEKHQLKIAKKTLLMSPEMARVMGGMTVDEAKKVLRHLTGKNPRGRTIPEILNECDKLRAALRRRMNPLTEKQKEATARAAKVLETKGYQSFLYFLGRNLAKHEEKTKARQQRRNPDETRAAVRLFEKFHGRDPKEITEKHVSAAIRKDYTALGDLEHLKVITPLGQCVCFQFENDGVKLASSPDGKQLYCIGGNQNLSSCLDHASLEKDFIDLGECVQVQYCARKVHGNFEPVSYYHKFGEKTGARPQLAYDKLKRQIFFVGGEYFIDTKQGVSPGIEN